MTEKGKVEELRERKAGMNKAEDAVKLLYKSKGVRGTSQLTQNYSQLTTKLIAAEVRSRQHGSICLWRVNEASL